MSKLIVIALALVTLSACTSEFIIVEGRPGTNGIDGTNGTNGIDGVNGQDGANGLNSLIATAPSTSCATGGISVLSGLDSDRNNVLDIAEVTASAEVCNGAAGANGQNGQDGQDGQNAPPTPFTPTEFVDPCGDAPNRVDEVLLRLANGQLLVSFSDNAAGLNTRFAVLSPGTYMTTDGTSCLFTVQNNGTVVW